MTTIRGYYVKIATCCGANYCTARYGSLNFTAFEYWTDGWREGSVKANDSGLRRCKCGNFFVLGELVEIAHTEEAEFPYPDQVGASELPEAIAQARSPLVELAGRDNTICGRDVVLNRPGFLSPTRVSGINCRR